MTEHVAFQFQLTREQHRRLKQLAGARQASMGSLIRESVAEYLNDLPVEEDPAYGIVGLIDDGQDRPHGSVAVHHDAYLADALETDLPARATGARRKGEPRHSR